jgi:hypothetical protein
MHHPTKDALSSRYSSLNRATMQSNVSELAHYQAAAISIISRLILLSPPYPMVQADMRRPGFGGFVFRLPFSAWVCFFALRASTLPPAGHSTSALRLLFKIKDLSLNVPWRAPPPSLMLKA